MLSLMIFCVTEWNVGRNYRSMLLWDASVCSKCQSLSDSHNVLGINVCFKVNVNKCKMDLFHSVATVRAWCGVAFKVEYNLYCQRIHRNLAALYTLNKRKLDAT
jgi:hypothetical protein